MPKRYIDYEAAWASDKIAACNNRVPATSGVYYLWFYGLADANGNLELTNPKVIHGKVAVNLPFLSVDDVVKILIDFRNNGLLFTWLQDGKLYGYWTGSEKEGRLPPKAIRGRYSCLKVHTPKDKLKVYEEFFAKHTISVEESLSCDNTHDVIVSESRGHREDIAKGLVRTRLKTTNTTPSISPPYEDAQAPQALSSQEAERPKQPEPQPYEPGDSPRRTERGFTHGSRKRNSQASGAVHAEDPHKYDGLG